MLDRFTETAKQLVTAARSLAETCNHSEIDNEHLLRAIFDHPQCSAWKILLETNVPWHLVEREFTAHLVPNTGNPVKISGFSDNVKRAIERVFVIVEELGHNWISSALILLGIFESGSNVSQRLLRSWGLDSAVLMDKIRKNGDVGGSLETAFRISEVDSKLFELSKNLDENMNKVFDHALTIARTYKNNEVNLHHLFLSLAFLSSRQVIDIAPLDPSRVDLVAVKELTTPKLAPAEPSSIEAIVFSDDVRITMVSAIHEALSYEKREVGIVDFVLGLALIQPALAQSGIGYDYLSIRRLMLGAPRLVKPAAELVTSSPQHQSAPIPSITIPPAPLVTQQLPTQPLVFPQISLRRYNADKGAVITIPQKFAEEWGVMGLNINENVLTVAMVNPADLSVIAKLRELTGMEIAVIKTEDKDLRAGFRMNY